jgi:SAM-dependent methyltransferase
MAPQNLPWADASFDAALSQLVLTFVDDPERVASEARRVLRTCGMLAACTWLEGDALQAGELLWRAVAQVDPPALERRRHVRFRAVGEFADLFRQAGLRDIGETVLQVHATYQDFDDFWSSALRAAGGIGTYMRSTDGERLARVREAARVLLGDPSGSFELKGRACATRARV